MEVAAFLKGILVGFSIAAPVGPIAVLCIGRTLNAGVRAGVLSGLGTAAADSVYGLIAALGLTAVSSLFLAHGLLLRFCGSLLSMKKSLSASKRCSNQTICRLVTDCSPRRSWPYILASVKLRSGKL